MKHLLLFLAALAVSAGSFASHAQSPRALKTEHFDRDPGWEGHNGPTRSGHYFIPTFRTATGGAGKVDRGPVLTPGKNFEWSLLYDPTANGGDGEMRVSLGAESVTLALPPGHKARGVELDRFGLFNSTSGGGIVRIYLDDLQYTASKP